LWTHALRRTVGAYASATGANALLIRNRLGHRTLAMTGRYISNDADSMRLWNNKAEGRTGGAKATRLTRKRQAMRT
jgi:integrase